MADFEMNNNEEIEELGDIIYTLTDEDTGEEIDFQLIARATIDDVLYFALVPADDEECEEYVILRRELDENGEEMLVTIEDDEEFDRVADLFDDEFSDFDYDGEEENN